MEKLLFEQSQKPALIKGLQVQIDDLKVQLAGLYKLMSQLDNTLVDVNFTPFGFEEQAVNQSTPQIKRSYSQREGIRDYFGKVKTVLEKSSEPLTTRGILSLLYENYPNDFNVDDDRKNVASLSSILTEKTAEEKIVRFKPAVGHAIFSLLTSFPPEKASIPKPNEITIADTYEENNFIYEPQRVEQPANDDDDLPF